MALGDADGWSVKRREPSSGIRATPTADGSRDPER